MNYLKKKLDEFSNWFVNHTPESVKSKVSTAFTTISSKISSLFVNTEEEEFFDVEEEEEEFHDAPPPPPPPPPPPNANPDPELEIHEAESALRGFSETYDIQSNTIMAPTDFLSESQEIVRDLWEREVEARRGLKTKLILECVMVRATDEGDVEVNAHFHSNTHIVLPATDLDDIHATMTGKILESLATYLKKGSGWRVLRVFLYPHSSSISE